MFKYFNSSIGRRIKQKYQAQISDEKRKYETGQENLMKQAFFRSKIFQVAGNAAQPNISGEQLDNILLVTPP